MGMVMVSGTLVPPSMKKVHEERQKKCHHQNSNYRPEDFPPQSNGDGDGDGNVMVVVAMAMGTAIGLGW